MTRPIAELAKDMLKTTFLRAKDVAARLFERLGGAVLFGLIDQSLDN
jgi:hypothetical protein